jgi:ATP-dependent DNA helicase PIF1
VFIDILNKLRMGVKLLPSEVGLLLDHKSETRNAIKLFSTREEVKRVNDQMFNSLPTRARSYKCLDHFKWNEKHGNLRSKGDFGPDGSMLSLREHRFESHIQLKKGMLVVLLHNLDLGAGLVNGSQGTIQGFEDYNPAKMPKAAEKGGSMGMGRAGNAPNTPLPGVPVLQGDHAAFREDQLKQYAAQMEYKAWPIVRFLNGVERTVYADCTVNQLGDEAPYSLLCRTQVPLMAAWAMTTHKSQGMTLNRVIVNLERSFEQGQAYVARKLH